VRSINPLREDLPCRGNSNFVPRTALPPFRPFTLQLADGRSLKILHPDFLFITPAGRTVIVAHEDDSFSIIDLLLVTEIEVGPSQPARA
jgi:hypothetical protein